MFRTLAASVVALLLGAAGSAQSNQDPWPPPGVHTATTPGVTRPEIVSQVQPLYSRIAQQEKIQGVVTIACVIEPDGTVGPARVIQSLDRKFGLDEAALAAAKSWRFKPGTKDGAPGVLLVLRSDDFLETVAILESRTLPGGFKQPLTIGQVQKFTDIMRTSGAAVDLDSLGVGQALAGSHWWVWQEMHAPTSHIDRIVNNFQMPEAAAFSGMRVWHFTTAVNGTELRTIFVTRLVKSGQTAEMIDTHLRASGRLFDQILRRVTLTLR